MGSCLKRRYCFSHLPSTLCSLWHFHILMRCQMFPLARAPFCRRVWFVELGHREKCQKRKQKQLLYFQKPVIISLVLQGVCRNEQIHPGDLAESGQAAKEKRPDYSTSLNFGLCACTCVYMFLAFWRKWMHKKAALRTMEAGICACCRASGSKTTQSLNTCVRILVLF